MKTPKWFRELLEAPLAFRIWFALTVSLGSPLGAGCYWLRNPWPLVIYVAVAAGLTWYGTGRWWGAP